MRSRLTYSNVMATIAVFLALGGSSYAAVKLSKGQVKSKHIAANAVTSSKVKNGSLKAADFGTGQLPAGAKGDKGAPGAKGDPGVAGKDFTVNTRLQSGQTETGTFAMHGTGDYAWANVQYRIPLTAAIPDANAHIISPGGPMTAECPGDGQAAAGHLCVYVKREFNLEVITATDPRTADQDDGTAPDGFGLFGSTSDPTSYGHGLWAVTAP